MKRLVLFTTVIIIAGCGGKNNPLETPQKKVVITTPALTLTGKPAEEGLERFIRKVEPDKFNKFITPTERKSSRPKRGGRIVIRIPVDIRDFNPVTNNDAQAAAIQNYLYDAMILRDPESLEWRPWVAWKWEILDRVDLKNGKNYVGQIISIDSDAVTFAPGRGRISVGKIDVKEIKDTGNGTKNVVFINNERYTGRVKEYEHTIEITPAVVNPMIISKRDIKETEDSPKKLMINKNVVLRFTLRDGVKWHDGVPLTVTDVKFSLDAIRNPYIDAAPLRNYYQDISSLKILDDHTVEFVYKRPYFKSLDMCGGMMIIPRHRYHPEKYKNDPEGFARYFNKHPDDLKPIGTGPYIFSKWDKGKRIILKRNPDYWASRVNFPYRDKDMPYLDEIVYMVINNKTASLIEMSKGSIDADFNIEPDQWAGYSSQSELFRNKIVPAWNITPLYTYIGWNEKNPLFQDERVRVALTHLIPREKILKDIHHGLGFVVTGNFFINSPSYDSSIKPYPYDPKKAVQLLREAGWVDHDGDGIIDKDGKPFEFEYLIHNGRDYHQRIADIMKESIEKAHIRMTIRKIDWTVFAKTVNDRQFDAMRFAWGTSIDGDPFQIWHSSQIENRGSNYIGYRNEEVDSILVTARETFNAPERWKMYRRMHRILHEEQPYTFLFCFKELAFYHKKFRGVKFYAVRPGYDLTEWYINEE